MLPAVVVVLVLCAPCVLSVPYDSYPTYPSSAAAITTTASSSSSNDNSILGGIENGLQRVWEGLACIGECRQTWGWTGNHFGADPWGGVLNAGDPMPYVPDSSSSTQSGAAATTAGLSTSTEASSSAGAFGILDVTTTARPTGGSITFSVFTVPTLTRLTTSTSSSATTTSTPPPPPTTQSPSPTPEPQPQTTQRQQDPAPTTTQAPAPTPDTSNNNNNNNFTPSSDQEAYLAAHNSARAAHGASDVTWSSQLEGFAHEWAKTCQFQHSGGKFGRVGENLAAGTGNYGIAEMVGDWMAEVTEYDPNNPVASHFTQVVWKGTSQIGCAKATCGGIFRGASATFYVCEYLDAGNVSEQFGANVQK